MPMIGILPVIEIPIEYTQMVWIARKGLETGGNNKQKESVSFMMESKGRSTGFRIIAAKHLVSAAR